MKRSSLSQCVLGWCVIDTLLGINCGMIATGNHQDSDPLRGAPRSVRFCTPYSGWAMILLRRNVTGHRPGVPDDIFARCAIVRGHCPPNYNLPARQKNPPAGVAGGKWSYKKAAATASTTAGSILATWSFLPHTRLTPTQKIRMEPIMERFDSAASVISGLISPARAVMLP